MNKGRVHFTSRSGTSAVSEWLAAGLFSMYLQDEEISDYGDTQSCEDRAGHIDRIMVDNNNRKRAKQGEDDGQE